MDTTPISISQAQAELYLHSLKLSNESVSTRRAMLSHLFTIVVEAVGKVKSESYENSSVDEDVAEDDAVDELENPNSEGSESDHSEAASALENYVNDLQDQVDAIADNMMTVNLDIPPHPEEPDHAAIDAIIPSNTSASPSIQGDPSQEGEERLQPSLVNLYDLLWYFIDHGSDIPNLLSTIFLWASYYNIIDLLDVLVTLGVDINYADNLGLSGLLIAATGEYDQLSLPHTESLPAHTPEFDDYYYALDSDSLDTVRVLIDLGGNVNQTDVFGRSALYLAACDYENSNLIPFLLLSGANVPSIHSLHQSSIVHKMLQDMDPWPRKVLMDKIYFLHHDVFHCSVSEICFKTLLKSPLFVKESVKYKKQFAVDKMKLNEIPKKAVKMLESSLFEIPANYLKKLSKDSDMTIEQWLGAHLARKETHKIAMSILFAQGLSFYAVDVDESSIFTIAATNDNLDTIEYLLDEDVLPDSDPILELNIMYNALSSGAIASVRKLLEHGVEMRIKGPTYDISPLIIASHYGYIDLVETFLYRGEDVEEQLNSVSALLGVCKQSSQLCAPARMLVTLGNANVNAMSSHQQHSPLQAAAAFGAVSIVRMLLQHGADLHYTDELGRTALDHAVYHQQMFEKRFAYPQIAVMLLEAGAVLVCRGVDRCRTDHWTKERIRQFYHARGEVLPDGFEEIVALKDKLYFAPDDDTWGIIPGEDEEDEVESDEDDEEDEDHDNDSSEERLAMASSNKATNFLKA